MKATRVRASIVMAVVVACFFASATAASQTSTPEIAQNPSMERVFHVSRTEAQKALRELPGYPSGKLPTLEGFADPGGRSLDTYKRAYYEYKVQMKPSGPAETTVSVTATITAWNTGNAAGQSGYRLVKSSGRLESDLLDALNEKLNPQSSAAEKNPALPAAAPLPDSPSASTAGSLFNTSRLTSAPSGTLPAKASPATPVDPATAKRLQALSNEEKSLQEILHSQARPSNLAIVKRSNTPIVSQPVAGGSVMFQADAEDEFEVLDNTDEWVHIKITDLSRAWVRRDYVDLPGAATVSIVGNTDQQDRELVRQTKEEVASFPGQWEPLNGRQVKIIWVQPLDKDTFGSGPKWNLAKTIFRKADAGGPVDPGEVAGVVVIFDSQDGGMTATTVANLQQWRAGHLSDDAFWKRCWRDPVDAFGGQN